MIKSILFFFSSEDLLCVKFVKEWCFPVVLISDCNEHQHALVDCSVKVI